MGFKIGNQDKGSHYAKVVQDWCRKHGFTVPVTEHHFCKPRMFRFDLAWPEDKVAIEFQGGNWTQGRHTRGAGFERDCEKMSLAAIKGWRVLLVTYSQIDSGQLYSWIEQIFPVIE